ncbi:MAG: hypothetical protein M3Q32_04685 [Pseudomonadota bacterium]|nr:hypothetical protein [Burkholderiales bacterium]MDQ3195668.1 hypothetical protein [Pseudomonadota bacterium]
MKLLWTSGKPGESAPWQPPSGLFDVCLKRCSAADCLGYLDFLAAGFLAGAFFAAGLAEVFDFAAGFFAGVAIVVSSSTS